MQKFIQSCIFMQASAQECRRALGRIVRKYPAEKREMLPSCRELRRLIRFRRRICWRRCVWHCVVGSSANVSSAAAGVLRLKLWRRLLSAHVALVAWIVCGNRRRVALYGPQLIGAACWKVCNSRLLVGSLTVCTFESVSVFGIGCKCLRMVCALVAILPG